MCFTCIQVKFDLEFPHRLEPLSFTGINEDRGKSDDTDNFSESVILFFNL